MCGIAGFWSSAKPWEWGELEESLARAIALVRHRGPDDAGGWADREAGIALAHRRLSIIDLSAAGRQPMHSRSGRYTIVYNGEIYNFKELRERLERAGHQFIGHSDTEVMLAAFSEWGVQSGLRQMVGMFAFALWDKQERVLHLGRDRLGEKPLYYGYLGGDFVFGSEVSSFRVFPRWEGCLDPTAVALYFRHNYVPAPFSIFQGIAKLRPGTVLSLSHEELRSRHLPQPQPYWSLSSVLQAQAGRRFTGTPAEAVAELRSVLSRSVAQQMVADVPLGAFLSGGVDSSTVVALMQAQSSQPIRTFTVGFEEAEFDEAGHARAVAAHLGTAHTELYLSASEAAGLVHRLASIYDEPFADASQLPTYCVAQLARASVTVSLSGDGGDELFGGYDRYQRAQQAWRRISGLPGPLRVLTSYALGSTPARWAASSVDGLRAAFRGEMWGGSMRPRLSRWARAFASTRAGDLYLTMINHGGEAFLTGTRPAPPGLGMLASAPVEDLTLTEQLMWLDSVSYLPDDILVKVDRASMAVSLESRIPLLDHRVVEFAWSLPLELKVRRGQTKWVLREVLRQYVPPALTDRPKMGFGIPLGGWLRGRLRDWAEALLSEQTIAGGGILDVRKVREAWQQHLQGADNLEDVLWMVLMFQGWRESGARPLSKPQPMVGLFAGAGSACAR